VSRYVVADLSPAHQRGRAISRSLLTITAGAVVGPDLLGPTSHIAHLLGLPGPAGLYLIALGAFALAPAAHLYLCGYLCGGRDHLPSWSGAGPTCVGLDVVQAGVHRRQDRRDRYVEGLVEDQVAVSVDHDEVDPAGAPAAVASSATNPPWLDPTRTTGSPSSRPADRVAVLGGIHHAGEPLHPRYAGALPVRLQVHPTPAQPRCGQSVEELLGEERVRGRAGD
jgi:hypothetical protein